MTRPIGNRRQIAVEALASGASFTGAAEVARCCERTIRRWWQEQPEFQSAVAAARAERFQDARSSVKSACVDAVAALWTIVRDVTTSDSARIRAAVAILDVGLRVHEMEDMERRLADVERALGEHRAA